MPSDSLERLAAKRQKVVDQRLHQQTHNNATPTLNHSFHTKTEFQGTTNHTGKQNASPGGHSSLSAAHKLCSTSEAPVSESREHGPKGSERLPPQGDSDGTHQQLSTCQQRKKKSKKHKDKERERLKDNQGLTWLETSPDLKQKPETLESKAPSCTLCSFTDTRVWTNIIQVWVGFGHVGSAMYLIVYAASACNQGKHGARVGSGTKIRMPVMQG